jgi:hypothetical protein
MSVRVQIGTVVVDATIRETHSAGSDVTEHPVEDGSDIVDHCHLKQRVLQIEGLITNQPLEMPQSHADGVKKVDRKFEWKGEARVLGVEVGGAGLIGMAVGAVASMAGLNQYSGTAMGFEPEFDRITAVREELLRLRNERNPIEITTEREVYPNMIIQNFDETRDGDYGDAMSFSLTAVQIRIVETEYTTAPPIPKVERGKPRQNKGKKPTLALDESAANDKSLADTSDEKVSLLRSAFGR